MIQSKQEGQVLTRDDVKYLLEMSKRGESWICRSQWFIDFAAKVSATLDKLDELNHNKSDEKSIESKKATLPIWDMELMYKHRGSKQPRFESLGKCSDVEYTVAVKNAKTIAEKFFAETFKEDEIERWEVRVRPSKPN
jgi:hypothetical protein